jgi:hypothetical protein
MPKRTVIFLKGIIQSFRNTSIYTKIALSAIILFHLINMIYCMEPLNNLSPVIIEDMIKADFLSNSFNLNFFGSHTMGFPILAGIVRYFTHLDFHMIHTLLGIMFSLMTVVSLFLLVKKICNESIAIFAIILYSSSSIVISYMTSYSQALSASVFFHIIPFVFAMLKNRIGIWMN